MSAMGSDGHQAPPTSSTSSCRGSRPRARGRAGRSGTARTCGTRLASGRTSGSACTRGPGTSARPRGLTLRRCLRHTIPHALPERHAELPQELACLVVGRAVVVMVTSRPRTLSMRVVVDLREDDLLPDAEGEVAAPVERVRVDAAEVADARHRDRHQPVEELVHAGAAQRDLAPIGMPSRILKPAIDLLARVMTGCWPAIMAELRRRRASSTLRPVLASPDAHVERDLLRCAVPAWASLSKRSCRRGRISSLVARLQARLRLRVGAIGRSSSIQLSPCWHMRILVPSAASVPAPTRVGLSHDGHTSITFEISIGASRLDHAAGRHLRAARAAHGPRPRVLLARCCGPRR